jgi:hypothetical protein
MMLVQSVVPGSFARIVIDSLLEELNSFQQTGVSLHLRTKVLIFGIVGAVAVGGFSHELLDILNALG